MTNILFEKIKHEKGYLKRGMGLFACLVILALVYLFQRFSYYHFFASILSITSDAHSNVIFVVNKSIRLIINDTTCLAIIYLLFQQSKYVRIGAYIQLFEMVILLPIYFFIKLSLEGDSEISSPLLSQVHRLIVNPTLMILLIIGFYYQKKQLQKS